MLGLETLVAFEAYALITSAYKRLNKVSVLVLESAAIIGIVVSFYLLLVDSRGLITWMFLVKQIVTGVLAVALMCVSCLILWIADPIRPNIVRHCRILTVYVSAIAGGYFLIKFVANRPLVDSIFLRDLLSFDRIFLTNLFLSILLCCLVAWMILIRKKGEEVPRFNAAGNSNRRNS